MKIGIITLGCKVNQYESDAIGQELTKMGHQVVTKLEPADLYILNTCAVTSIAEKKSRTNLAKMQKLNPNAKIIVCGCASQNNAQQFLKHKNVSVVLGTSGKNKIANLLSEVGNKTTEMAKEYEYFSSSITSRTRAFLKIQDGCNNFCTYCLIPYLRGRSRSRDIADIVREAKELEKTNKEIVLTGIDISDFRANGKPALKELMLALSGLSARIRTGSFEVSVIDDKLLQVLASMPNFCPQFHLSMQSGCDRILKLMNRHYTKEQFLQKVELIRKYFPNCAITTDVIVGFPTETDQDFAETVDTIKKAKFFEMHIFPYSSRKGTVASKMKMVDNKVKAERVKILEDINEIAKKDYILSQKHNVLTVLTENFENDMIFGHTENYIKIYLPKETPRHQFVKVTNLVPYLDGAKADIVD